jgi:exopolysaccharide production protein ExoZ
MKTKHIGSLDITRLSAALMVAIFHVGWLSWSNENSPQYALSGGQIQLSIFAHFGWIGRFGVEVFFVISGFVITQSAQSRSAYSFLRSRAARLLPTFWLCSCITLFALILFGQTHWKYLLYVEARSLLMLMPFPQLDIVYWTLAVEIVFYGLVFLLLTARSFDRIEILAASLAIYSLTYNLTRLVGFAPEISKLWLAENGCQFSLGILIWLISSKGHTPWRWIVVILALCGSLISISLICTTLDLNGGHPWQAQLVWISAVLLIALSANAQFEGNTFTRTLGLMTYPIYLLHDDIGCILLKITGMLGVISAAFIAFSAPIILAFLVLRLEPPIRRALLFALDIGHHWIFARKINQEINSTVPS